MVNAANHTLWIVSIKRPLVSIVNKAQTLANALYNLCIYPEYLYPLREEARTNQMQGYQHDVDSMPLLDSFLKETARMDPVDSSMLSMIDLTNREC